MLNMITNGTRFENFCILLLFKWNQFKASTEVMPGKSQSKSVNRIRLEANLWTGGAEKDLVSNRFLSASFSSP